MQHAEDGGVGSLGEEDDLLTVGVLHDDGHSLPRRVEVQDLQDLKLYLPFTWGATNIINVCK